MSGRGFYFRTGDYHSVNAVGHTAVDYNSPFADAFRAVLPAGRSGSVELLLDLPADAQDLTVTWYRGEVSQELEIPLP